MLNAAQGELSELIQDAGSTSRILLEQRFSSAEQDRLSSQEERAGACNPPMARPRLPSGPPGRRRKGPIVNSILIYRASFYLMLTVATTILCGEATDSRLDSFLPVGVAAAGVLAFFTVDQSRRWGLPRDLANVLALGTLGLLFWNTGPTTPR